MKNLISKIERYERACQGLCDKIETYVGWVCNNVPAEYRHKFGVVEFCSSSQFSWWSAEIDGKPIHSDVEKAGSFTYAGGNFNYPITRATRKQIIEFSKWLPVGKAQAESWLDSQIELAENL